MNLKCFLLLNSFSDRIKFMTTNIEFIQQTLSAITGTNSFNKRRMRTYSKMIFSSILHKLTLSNENRLFHRIVL